MLTFVSRDPSSLCKRALDPPLRLGQHQARPYWKTDRLSKSADGLGNKVLHPIFKTVMCSLPVHGGYDELKGRGVSKAIADGKSHHVTAFSAAAFTFPRSGLTEAFG